MILFYELTPSPAVPPHTVLTGDYFEVDQTAQQIKHKRGAATVAIYGAASWPGENLGEFPPYKPFAGVFKVVYPKEKRMPGQNVSCTAVVENQTTGAVTFKFSSGNNIEYASWAAVGEIADSLDASPDIAEKVLAMKAFRSSPDGANKTTQVGASVSINGLADTPVVYTEPQ